MKTALISCNIGGIDNIFPPEKQSEDFEYWYYSENTMPFPLPNLDNRMRGKYLKTQTHRFIDADIIIWVDSSIEIISKDFVKTCIEKLQGNDIVIELHKQRKNVYQELEYIIDAMKAGDRYLLRRYYRQPLYQEYEFYKQSKLPKDFPLYQCSFFARWNNDKLAASFDQWFDLILRYSNFDQTEFSFIAWLHYLKIKTIDTEDLFIRHKHINYNL